MRQRNVARRRMCLAQRRALRPLVVRPTYLGAFLVWERCSWWSFTVPRTELERSSREERPALEQIEERMGLPRGVLDRNFGVVEVSDESWCVRGPGWCASQIQDHRVFSDSVIRPVGLPEPESK